MVEEAWRARPTEPLREPDLPRRLVDEVRTADDEIDRLPGVIDDDREAVRPVAGSIADHEVAVRGHRALTRPEEQVIEPLVAIAQVDPEARDSVAGKCPRATAARAARSGPATAMVSRPCRERRPGAGAAVRVPGRRQLVGRGVVRGLGLRVRLANGSLVRNEAKPPEVLDERDVEGGSGPFSVVILDPEQDGCAAQTPGAPDPDRIRDLTKMEEAGRRRGEARPNRRRQARSLGRRSRRRRP